MSEIMGRAMKALMISEDHQAPFAPADIEDVVTEIRDSKQTGEKIL